jgi:phage-related holin
MFFLCIIIKVFFDWVLKTGAFLCVKLFYEICIYWCANYILYESLSIIAAASTSFTNSITD